MTLFRLDASINPDRSASRAIADIVESEWLAENPAGVVVRRNLGTEPIAADAWTGALRASWTPEAARTQEQTAAIALAAGLAEEVRSADAVLLAVPLYNFGIPQHVKTWIDVVLAGATPSEALLAGKAVVLVVVRGGAYGAGTPREGWDHSTGYLRRIVADVWGADLTIVEREFTLVGVNPALDDFKELADQFKDAAHAAAAEAGKALGAGAAVSA
jgi:FMN-dependent NADH-azoreductase